MPDDTKCTFFAFKDAPQVEAGLPFQFIKNVDGVETEITLFSNDESKPDFVTVDAGGTVSFTELPQEGWTLENIECLQGTGVEVEKADDSVTFRCLDPGVAAAAFCVFQNRISADKIPTLSEWGMISAAAGLGLIGVFFALRKRLQASNGSEQA